jgi:hypothetical protein
MSAAGCYVVGSVILLVGTVITNGPTFMIVASGPLPGRLARVACQGVQLNIPRFYNTDVATEHYLGMRWPVAIWQAVLKQAVDDILEGPAGARAARHGDARAAAYAFRAAAEHWVEDDVNEPRRFVWVCEQLGLEDIEQRR